MYVTTSPAVPSFPSFFHGVDAYGLVSAPSGQGQHTRAIANALFPPSMESTHGIDSSTASAAATRAHYLNGMASVGCDGKEHI
jgi:hypothetical protein